jgi:DNA repair protein RecO (recombination protein O)
MRHKYGTRALVIARTPLGEANALVTLLTHDVGLVRARVQGVRRPGAKLASALLTFTESDVTLVRGTEGWRVTGATLAKHWFNEFPRAARVRAARVVGLVLRLVPAETPDPAIFALLTETFAAFTSLPEALSEAIECRAVLRLLSSLGFDAGSIPDLVEAGRDRTMLVTRINRGIELSGL